MIAFHDYWEVVSWIFLFAGALGTLDVLWTYIGAPVVTWIRTCITLLSSRYH